jgi:hypothetical protein
MSNASEQRLQLLRAGFSPLPLSGKLPVLKEWQKRQDTSEGDIEIWAKLHADATNTGILTKSCPALDIDILSQDAAKAVEELARERFEEGGYILVRVGLHPKRAIPFRSDQPFKKITALLTPPDGGKEEKLEFLADGQQLVLSAFTRIPASLTSGSVGSPAASNAATCRTSMKSKRSSLLMMRLTCCAETLATPAQGSGRAKTKTMDPLQARSTGPRW